MSKSTHCYKNKTKQRKQKLVLENTIGRVLADLLTIQPDFFWQNSGNE